MLRTFHFVLSALAVLVLAPVSYSQSVGWLNSSWQYRSTVSIANPGGTTLSAYQVHVVLGAGFDFTKVQANGADIRFTASDGVTLLPFWIESWSAGSSRASLWVKVPSIPSTGATVYLYYGDPSAGSASNGTNTFIFFDDFAGSTIDATKWSFPAGQGGFSNAGGKLEYNGPTAGFGPSAEAMQNGANVVLSDGIVEYNLMGNGGFDEMGLMYRGQESGNRQFVRILSIDLELAEYLAALCPEVEHLGSPGQRRIVQPNGMVCGQGGH